MAERTRLLRAELEAINLWDYLYLEMEEPSKIEGKNRRLALLVPHVRSFHDRHLLEEILPRQGQMDVSRRAAVSGSLRAVRQISQGTVAREGTAEGWEK
jgi:hypothetical protein